MTRLPATTFDLTGMVRSIVISEEQKPQSPQNLSVELGRCRTALCTAAELSLLLGNRPGQLDDVQATLDALRSQLRGLGFSA